jgi:glycosyltransferase involved in cell wall biosynthesis
MDKHKISVSIITLNEEDNIRAACESVSWADEIVVVDSGSTDRTKEIATQCGARVLDHSWPGFAAQKQFAAERTTHEWLFSLDADEVVSKELGAVIKDLLSKPDTELADGYLIPRRARRWPV